jgi:hypothetical protein
MLYEMSPNLFNLDQLSQKSINKKGRAGKLCNPRVYIFNGFVPPPVG